MDLQAIRYAAMVAAMSFPKAVEVHARYLSDNGRTDDAEAAMLQFLEWDVANEETFGQDVRIVMVSREFSKEITTSVLWLNDHDIDVRCVGLRPYAFDSRVLLDVQQIIPLPEADFYNGAAKEKSGRTQDSSNVLVLTSPSMRSLLTVQHRPALAARPSTRGSQGSNLERSFARRSGGFDSAKQMDFCCRQT
ncbi:MAG TPA: hypothetical protein VEV37_00030 [Bryobacteraceae bacterium]|nr:hypothetical protein [Bryobacteraceae bacterium]